MEKDYSISFVRIVATIMIISCHIMQHEGSYLAWIFNVGVQVFLCMSGYLYGFKSIPDNSHAFFIKQFKKILIDYYIVFIPIAFIHLIIFKKISVLQFISGILTYTTIDGGGHLWYVPYILFCYLLTPFYLVLYEKIWANRNVIITTIFLIIICFALSKTFLGYFNSAWINCYLIGLVLGCCKKYNADTLYKRSCTIICVLACSIKIVQIYTLLICNIEMQGIANIICEQVYDFGHTLVGCTIFILLKHLFVTAFPKECPNKLKSIFNKTDRLSYDIYLTHNFVIQGTLSLLAITPYLFINILIAILITLLLAIIVNKVSLKIHNLI